MRFKRKAEVKGTHSELKELMRAQAREEKTADVTVVVLAIHLPDVAVSVRSH